VITPKSVASPASAVTAGSARRFTAPLRARASREALTDPLDDALDLFTSSDADAAVARRDLHQLLDSLPDRQRLPIVHVKLEGLSVVEAAQLTGMSESAIKVGVHRGLKALAARIRGPK